MARRLRDFPRLRAVAAVSVMLGGMRVLPSCDTPPTPGGACYTLAVDIAPDHACMLIGPPTVICGVEGAAPDVDGGGSLQGCYLASSEMRCWGSGGLGRAGVASAASPARVDLGATDGGTGPLILAMATGANRTCALLRGGKLRCWSGQESAASARDEDLPPVLQMSMGDEHLCVLLADRTVRCKGSNSDGQLGNGVVSDPSTRYMPVAGLRDVTMIAANRRQTCALASWGGVHCWGRLGAAAQPTPQRIAGLPREFTYDCVSVMPRPGSGEPNLRCTENITNRIVQLSVGGRHACGVDSRGGVWCWGDNEVGQLGPATQSMSSPSAVRVELDRAQQGRFHARSVTAGETHTCVPLVEGGSVLCWGDNRDGQLGQGGGSENFRVPIPPVTSVSGDFPRFSPALTGVNFLAAGGRYTCGILGGVAQAQGGGEVRCWGRLGALAPTPLADTAVQCCAPTPADPSGMCPNTQTDPRNCGRAGTVCAATQTCSNGTCGCATGQTPMGSTCVNTQTDVANCGAIGNRCALANVTTQRCSAGRCEFATGACAAGFADCDGMAANGCETNTATDVANCGACGTRCAGTNGMATCAMGACGALACAAGFADCDANRANGCEANLATDARNCGACGRACTGVNAMGTCAMSTCGPLRCTTGFQDCNNNPTDGCETNLSLPGAVCAVPPTALPSTVRFGAARHVVNLVDATAARQMASYLGCPSGRSCDGSGVPDAFYRYFPDDYDFLVAVSGAGLVGVTTAANMTALRRAAIPGTGLGARNMTSFLRGSPSRLRGLAMVNQSNTTSSPATLHEFAHYWGVELDPALLGNGAHWGVSGVRGELGGFDPGTAACMSGGPVNACPSASACCGAGTTSCGGACVDTSTDVNHCGSCGTSCGTNAGTGANACVGGRCRPTCAAGWADCDRNPANGCEVPSTTVEHCGGCFGAEAPLGCTDYGGGSWGPGTSCGASGQTVCPMISGRPPCATGLVTVATPSSTICCAAGASNCGGACSNPMTDAANCGACGVMCGRGAGTTANVCTAGACRPTCATGYADCDGNAANGCESRLDGPGSCGACGTRCAAGQSCTTAGGRSTCTSACGAAAGQACCASGAACGAGLTCGTSVALNLPPGPISTTCRTTGRSSLPWFTAQSPGDTLPYAPLELYLMGLVDRAGAGGPWAVLDGARAPASGTIWAGTRVRSVSIDDLVTRYGARPAATPGERAYRTAVVIFSEAPVSDAWLANVERWSAILGNDGTDACLLSFQTATGGRATMSTVLGAPRVAP